MKLLLMHLVGQSLKKFDGLKFQLCCNFISQFSKFNEFFHKSFEVMTSVYTLDTLYDTALRNVSNLKP